LFLKRHHFYISSSDQELLDFYDKKKDNQIIGEFYNRYGHLVFGVCMKYLKNVQNAEDLTIELFEELGKKLTQHRIVHFKSWLYVTTKNSCLMLLRKKNFHFLSFDETSEYCDEENSISTKEILEIKLEALEVALTELNQSQAICIKAFYLEKKSYDEICEIHSITLNEVKSHIQNGKRNLKLILLKLISKK
jgi:RNA polymerase sigma-70 factor (ECF subfamily)